MSSRFELPTDRLATTDEHGNRIYLDPDVVHGHFHRIRNWVQPILLMIFLLIPWIHLGGRPLILLDIPHRRFLLFGGIFWAHDAPLLLFLLALFTLTVAFMTSVWGRAWCGWACPQTVFIEAVFRRIERWIEGHEHSYRRPPAKMLSTGQRLEKMARKLAKWAIFALVTLVISHSFIAYFVGMDDLHRMILRPPSEAPGWFLFMSIVTGILLFDFGWFREQFCVIACPYGKIQALFMDEHSKVIAYDYKRGEPRRGSAAPDASPQGDCVNCYRCVQVCPTGIDIRRGTQLECIGCTACIDACDEVMMKIHKPLGLVRYASFAAIEAKQSRIWRPRVFIYLILITAVAGGFAAGLATHAPIHVEMLRAIDSPYQQIEEPKGPKVINHFHAEIMNGTDEELHFALDPAVSGKEMGIELIMAQNPITITPGRKTRADFFVKFPKALTEGGKKPLAIHWSTENKSFSGEKEVELVGPRR